MTIPVENCDIVEEDKQYCAKLPTEVICSNSTVSDGYCLMIIIRIIIIIISRTS